MITIYFDKDGAALGTDEDYYGDFHTAKRVADLPKGALVNGRTFEEILNWSLNTRENQRKSQTYVTQVYQTA